MNLEREITRLNSIVEEYLQVDSIQEKHRKQDTVLGRMIVCNILMDNGLTPAMLARYYKQHRTNYYHYRKKHENFLEFPKTYPEYIQLYDYTTEEYRKRAKDVSMLSKLQRLEILEEIDKNVDSLLQRKVEVLKTIEIDEDKKNSFRLTTA
tara:strand:+ start:2622 stop:3074 length:453 start_codon:yes stop_codon:yes gene_type:complete